MNLNDWTVNATQWVMTDLPTHDYDSALVLVQTWLTSNPWVPDDEEEPAGDGVTTGDKTPDEAADEITAEELGSIYTVTVEIPVTIKMSSTKNFASGTTLADMVTSLESLFEGRISALVDEIGDGAHVTEFDWSSSTNSKRDGGSLSTVQRVAINAEISGAYHIDPAAVATAAARSKNGLDDTWMAEQVYIRTGSSKSISVSVVKYTSNTYTTLDSPGYKFYVKLDPQSMKLRSIVRVDNA